MTPTKTKTPMDTVHKPLPAAGAGSMGCRVRCPILLDLRRQDFTGVDLMGAHLEGSRLSGAIFPGTTVGTLLAAGMRPRDILVNRASAPEDRVRRLDFAVSADRPRFVVTAKEAARVCAALSDTTWDELDNASVCPILHAGLAWYGWVTRCKSRAVLDWVSRHRVDLARPAAQPLPHFGTSVLGELIDEVTDVHLTGGRATNPERLFADLGTEHVLSGLSYYGPDTAFPEAPFEAHTEIIQLRSAHQLQRESALMNHCVRVYDAQCARGESYMYHAGPPAPGGSTVEIYPDGRMGQHRARYNNAPLLDEQRLIVGWLEKQGYVATEGLDGLCRALERAGIETVEWHSYYYSDETTTEVQEITYYDGAEHSGLPAGINDDDFEEHGKEGYYRLTVAPRFVAYLAPSDPPDEDEYNDEDDEDEEDE
jgi:hypothetical protein